MKSKIKQFKIIPQKSITIGKDLTSKEQRQKEFYIKIKATKHTHTGFMDANSLKCALSGDWGEGFDLEVTEIELIK